MSAHGFTSAFAQELDAYLAFKEKMGFYGSSRIWYLKRFDRYCLARARTVFDRDTVEGWVTEQLAASGRYCSWMSYIRDVGRWLQMHGDTDAYVLSDRWKASAVRAQPYLLSAQEIERFFTAAAQLHAQSPWRWQAVAFFTLMHSCGMRTGEVRLLSPDCVDLGEGHVDVLWSKGKPQSTSALERRRRQSLGCMRAGIPQTVRCVPPEVLRLRRRQPGHGRDGRTDVQPRLGPGWIGATGGRPAASAL